jgi:ATP-dependent RNA helicase RhlE
MTFSQLGLSEFILRAIADAGYTSPTPIQAQAIPQVLTGGDLLAGAQTVTGKSSRIPLCCIPDNLRKGRQAGRSLSIPYDNSNGFEVSPKGFGFFKKDFGLLRFDYRLGSLGKDLIIIRPIPGRDRIE